MSPFPLRPDDLQSRGLVGAYASKACVIVRHACRGIVDCGRLTRLEGAGEGASLEDKASGRGLRVTPLPHVAGQIVDAIRADTAAVRADRRGRPDAGLADVALGHGRPIAPWVEVTEL